MAIILISQGFRGVDFLRKPSVYLHFKAFAGPTTETTSEVEKAEEDSEDQAASPPMD